MGEVAASFALLGFFAFFFFFFLAAAETDGAVAVAASSSPANGGDGGGVKIWTGSAAVQESVSEVEVIGWENEAEVWGVFSAKLEENARWTDLDTGSRASSSLPSDPPHHAPHVYSEREWRQSLHTQGT